MLSSSYQYDCERVVIHIDGPPRSRAALASASPAIRDAKANELEGAIVMGGKHGGQTGMPRPENGSGGQQSVVRDKKGQEQPTHKYSAQCGD